MSDEKKKPKPEADEPATEALPTAKATPDEATSETAEPTDTEPEKTEPEKTVSDGAATETAATEKIDVTKASGGADSAPDTQGAVPAEDTAPVEDTAPADDTVSDAETAAIPVATGPKSVGPQRIPPRGQPAVPPPAAKPQRVGPAPTAPQRRGGRRWLLALLAAVVLVAVVAVAGFVYLSRDRADTSPEAQIRTSITSFTQALSSGDLATLRAGSCGDLAAYYRDIPDAEFADVHRVAVEQGNIPVVDGVDAVQITDDTAIAQVIAYTAADPASRSPRTFDLRLENDEWKICNPE